MYIILLTYFHEEKNITNKRLNAKNLAFLKLWNFGKNPVFNISPISKKHIFRVSMRNPYIFQKLKILKTVEMPSKYMRHYFSWMWEDTHFTAPLKYMASAAISNNHCNASWKINIDWVYYNKRSSEYFMLLILVIVSTSSDESWEVCSVTKVNIGQMHYK